MQNFFEILPEKSGTAIALGYFDGLHKGHRNVISLAAAEKKNGLIPVCFTFSKSPKSVLYGTQSNALMTNEDKIKTLERLGIERTYQADFEKIMNMPAKDFAQKILIDTLKAEKLFCGFNYRYGKNGEGSAETLKSFCDSKGITLTVVPAQESKGKIVSSTLIRKLIADGNVKRANELMCSRFGFSSVIEHGKRLGRELGTPTINQPLCSELVVPKFGVYASIVTLENGETYCGVTNIGIKPTVGGNTPLCETWMPKYSGGEIYGQSADVRLLEFIRPERKFSGIDELKNAIIDNSKTALKIYEQIKGTESRQN
ncbi:riboflavin biosynthesis protein RibF [Ruminococcus sp.]|jgi:riboflavin kinase/FMN adenylyltransferase|uniref:riboflavin biosynthesis protein RibF n=1 Tax=Ruminococcus sp. TaxID=41978 RepID=UPI0026055AF0|nr:riboflavin biosynthesis protein RibF [Ruminococcus sp.]MCI2112085.1 riboflavin biosynthesis protein RibF [Ruminococcus sp.]MDD6989447.1 riboflavin biosynthesis protein RibF [Ruminococcus sp.]MDY6202300.1 riboflavin biosynthesis protein RibF [Ruminococcus sp.]